MSKIGEKELIILKALWAPERLSAREIHESCQEKLGWSFSSTRTTLARMVEKDLLVLVKVHGIATYAAKQDKLSTMANLTRDFFTRVLEVKGNLPTAAFNNSKIFSQDELAELRDLIEKMAEDSQ